MKLNTSKKKKKENGNQVIGKEDNNLDALFERIEEENKKIRRRIYLFFRRWKGRFERVPRHIKYFIQRGRRGYSDEDLWNFDHYIATLLSRALKDFSERSCGYPGNMECYEDWKKIIDETQEGFAGFLLEEDQLFKDLENTKTEKERKSVFAKQHKRIKENNKKMKLFIDYLGSFWW